MQKCGGHSVTPVEQNHIEIVQVALTQINSHLGQNFTGFTILEV
jgi:hypothetical protein